MFGTKRPSMTSTCSRDAPAFSTVAISSPSLVKFAERIDGAISIMLSRFYGVGTGAGGRRFGLGVTTPRLVFVRAGESFELAFVRSGVPVAFTLLLAARFALAF